MTTRSELYKNLFDMTQQQRQIAAMNAAHQVLNGEADRPTLEALHSISSVKCERDCLAVASIALYCSEGQGNAGWHGALHKMIDCLDTSVTSIQAIR